MKTLTYKKLAEDTKKLAESIDGSKYDSLYAIPRGGVPIALMLSSHLDLPLVEEVSEKTLIVDDLIDSGSTLKAYPDNDAAVLYAKPHSPEVTYFIDTIDDWIEFPYEQTQTDAEDNVRRILEYIGEDLNREGLIETPKRYIKFLKQFLTPDEYNFTTFSSEGYDEMIVQKNIPFFSICEHHMAPFFGHATVGYIPNGKIVGLSKLTRTVEWYGRKLQNQERITHQIAQRLQDELNPVGVAVSLNARHFCMEMRGVRTHDVYTRTTKLIGAFKDKPEAREEFFNA